MAPVLFTETVGPLPFAGIVCLKNRILTFIDGKLGKSRCQSCVLSGWWHAFTWVRMVLFFVFYMGSVPVVALTVAWKDGMHHS